MTSVLRTLAGDLAGLLTSGCLLCDQPCGANGLPGLCSLCAVTLPFNNHACVRCALPLLPGGDLSMQRPTTCGRCLTRPPPYTPAVAPLLYEGFPRKWVRRLKERFGLVEGRLLGALLARAVMARREACDRQLPRPDALVPVPLARLRLARRGHNQAISLALPVANRLGVPLLRTAARRPRSTRPQRHLGRASRLENLQGAFASRRWQGECVAIVDDVMTTGATVTALATALLDAGAGQVIVLCATRTAADHRSVPPGHPEMAGVCPAGTGC